MKFYLPNEFVVIFKDVERKPFGYTMSLIEPEKIEEVVVTLTKDFLMSSFYLCTK